jgi:hypothetical protein
MDKKAILRAFNDHFNDFVKDVRAVFPDNEDLKFTEMAVKSIRSANPKMLIVTWKESVTDVYSDKIECGDKTFFLEKDYKGDLDGNTSADKIADSIDKLRQPIREMGEENQEKAMRYVQNLTKLSKLYFS